MGNFRRFEGMAKTSACGITNLEIQKLLVNNNFYMQLW